MDMTKKELEDILEEERIFEYNHERRLYGFLIHHAGLDYAEVSGKIPLSLAEYIQEGDPDNEKDIFIEGKKDGSTLEDRIKHPELDRMWKEIKQQHEPERVVEQEYQKRRRKFIQKMKKGIRKDELYVEFYQVFSEEAMRYVIKCIRDCQRFNDWAIGNL